MAASSISRPLSTCQRCGEPFRKQGNFQKYCDSCRYALKLERNRETRRRAAVRQGKIPVGGASTCLVCKGVFFAKHPNGAKYCSKACSRAEEQRKRRDTRYSNGSVSIGSPFPCRMCDAPVVAVGPKSRYCLSCRKKAYAARHERWKSRNPEKRKKIERIQREKQRARLNSDPNERRRVREYFRVYSLVKRRDARHRLDHRVSQMVRFGLKGRKSGRKWEHLVGYSLDDLVRHLERQFLPGMSWKNMGDWHIDHIVPVSHFDYRDHNDEGFRLCWAITNLRPLWKEENLKKGAKRLHLL